MIGVFVVIGCLWLALRLRDADIRSRIPAPLPLPTQADVVAWLAQRRQHASSEADWRTLRVFESAGYADAALATAQVTRRPVADSLDAQWRYEHTLQCALLRGQSVRAVAERLDIEDIPARAQAIREAVQALVRPTLVTPPVAPVLETALGPLAFKAHEPTRFQDLTTQPAIVERLEIMVRALRPPQAVPTRHVLLTGPAGLGKTLVAKIVCHELRRYNAAESQPLPRWFELYGSNLVTIADYDAVFREVLADPRPCVVFIDEIHALDEVMATKLYKLMEDGEYAFYGDLNPTRLPPVMLIGATTDYGDLHAALKRRFGEPMAMATLSRQALQDVVQRRPFPITAVAAEQLVAYTHFSGAPWEILSLAYEAEQVALAEREAWIGISHVERVAAMLSLDAYGLRPADRAVLTALHASPRFRGKTQELVCYALSQADCCLRAGLDPGEFAAVVKPRLQSRGFLVTRSGYGQALTETALTAYFIPQDDDT